MAALNTSLWRFFALSVTLHVLAVLLLYPIRPAPTPRPETIAVSLLPNSEKIEPAPKRALRSAPTRPSKAPTVVAEDRRPFRPTIPYWRVEPRRRRGYFGKVAGAVLEMTSHIEVEK